MQIRSLESEIGVALFNRTQRSVVLTQFGNAMLGEARHIPARVEQVVPMTSRASRGEIGKLVIGCNSVADYNVLPVVLREFRRAARRRGQLLQGCEFQPDLLALRVFVDVASPTANMPRKTRASV